MMDTKCRNFAVLIMFGLAFKTGDCGSTIRCFQCNSTDLHDPFQCREHLQDDIDIEPKPCDEVYNAAYCIKHTGRFEVVSIRCYQCFTPNRAVCSDLTIQDSDSPLSPQSCDHLFEANFCIKATGLHAGGVGTKRFCSSVDMGNYCNYISQPGDTKEYRSCVFTCSSDGCNSAPSNHLSSIPLLAVSFYFLL